METIGKYRLRYKIAQGGMAEIYAADSLSKKVSTGPICVKRIRPEFSSDAEFERMFEQEARIAMALQHPNVVRVFDFDKHDGRLFLSMEYIDGWDLKRVLSTARNMGTTVPVGFAFYVLKNLLSALHAARAVKVDGELKTVVHRDISPHNILVSKDGAIKLTDFGIAKAKGSSHVTRTGIIKGKLAYLSPEQATSSDVGPASDLYCAGLVLYEMLSGERFNKGQSDAELLAAVINPSAPQLSWLSTNINQFVQTLLAKDAGERFNTPTDALEAMDKMGLPAYEQEDAARFGFGLITSVAENSTGPFHISSVASVESTELAPLEDSDAFDAVPTRTSKQFPPQQKKMRNIVKHRIIVAGFGAIAVFGTLAFLFFGKQDGSVVSLDATTVKEQVRVNSALSDSGFIEKREVPIINVPESPLPDSSALESHIPKSKATPGLPLPQGSQDVLSEKQLDDKRMTVSDVAIHTEGTGKIQVLCRPWAHVKIDGVPMGTTPIRKRSLRIGKHWVQLRNDEMNFKKKILVQIRKGRTTRINESINMANVGEK